MGLGFLLLGCKSIEPLPPIEKIIDPPISQPKTSYISIPVELNLKSSFNEAEKSIPNSFSGKESSCVGLSYSYKMNRDSIKFSTNASGISFSTKLKYALDLSYCPKCTDWFSNAGTCVVPRLTGSCGIGEPLRNASISFSSKMSILTNYSLKSETTLSALKLIDPCQITFVNYDITSILDKEIKKEMKSIEKEIDHEISKIDIKSICTSAWKEMNKPININNYGYLNLNPSKIALTSLQFKDNHVYFDIGIESKPAISTSKTQENNLPLPNISEIKKVEGFNLGMDIFVAYDSLNSWISTSLPKDPIEVKRRKFYIDTLRLVGADESKLFVEIFFSGTRKGRIYLSAKPILDEKQQRIFLSDIQIELNTKSLLLKTAKWLLNDQIINKIEENANFDLKNALDEAKSEINRSINTKLTEQVLMNGTIESLSLKEIFPLSKGVFVRSEITGKMKLKIN